ncbi:hypothetical protein Landi51_10178 [Colletotrichum acutatum]
MEASAISQLISDCKAAFCRLIVSSGSASAPAWMEDRQAGFGIWAASFITRSSIICRHLEGLLEALKKILEIGFIEVENQEVSVRKPNYPDIREDSGSEASDSEVTTSSEPAEDDSLETLYEEQKCYIHKILKLLQRDSIATRK